MSESQDSFLRLVAELGRRRVFRTAALYLVFALVVVEVTEALATGPGGVPLQTVTLVAWGVMLGFPIAVGLAWTYDITPRGIVRTLPESERDRRRRRMSARVGFRLTLTGLAAAAVGAVTWVVLEPFLPDVEDPVVVEAAPLPPAGTVHVLPVTAAGGLDASLAERAWTSLLGRLSEEPGLRPVDPREIVATGSGDAASRPAARQAGAERVLSAELTESPEGVRLRAVLRRLGEGSDSSPVEAGASGPAEAIEDLVDRVVSDLAAAAGGAGGAVER